MTSSSSSPRSDRSGRNANTPLQQVVQRHGRPLHAGANQPTRLDRADRCWCVVAGVVDVFAVPRDSGAGARRTHLMTCRTGDILFGVDEASSRAEMSLLAVGRIAAELHVLPVDVVESTAETHPELASAIERWVGGLSRAVAGMVVPRPEITGRIGPDSMQVVTGGARICGDRESLVWLRELQDAMFLDMAGTGDDSAPFPLHADGWLLLPTQLEHVFAVDTQVVLSESTWRRGLARFHAALIESASTNIALALVDEYNRSAQRDRIDTVRMRRALLGGVALDSPGNRGVDVRAGTDPLAEVVAALASHLSAESPAIVRGDRDLPHAQRLRRLAASARLGLRDIRLPRRWWRKSGQAFVGWTDGDAPLALVPAGRRAYRMFDPSAGTWRKVDSGAAERIKPAATAVYGSLTSPKLTSRSLLGLALHGGAHDALALLLFGLAVAGAGLAAPVAAGMLVETAIPLGDSFVMWQLLLALCAAGIAGGAFHFLQGIASVRLLSAAELHAQSALVDRLLRLPIPFFRSVKAGTLAQHALGVSLIRRLLARGVVVSVLGGFFALTNLAVMAWFSPMLTLAAGALIGVAGAIIAGIQAVRVRSQQRAVAADGDTTGTALQLVRAIAKIRIAGAERRAFSLWMGGHAQKRYWTYRSRAAENGVLALTAALPLAASLVFFNLAAADPPLAPGAFVAFLTAFSAFLIAFIGLSHELTAALGAGVIFSRLKPILETAPETQVAARPVGPLSGRVEVNQVSFRYGQHSPRVLNGVSVKADPGQFIAIVGPSGSGKSTLMRLMLGFEQPESGGIYYDGQDLRRLDVQAARRQFGVVLQNCQVYTGTLFDNIAGGEPLGHEEAWEAAELAGVAEDIRAMPMGMFTFITDGGTLSAGQRQRLLLARALIRKPKILLLDEATSALDNLTQASVASSIDRLNVTRIVIAHRLTTIKAADMVYVLDKGNVVEKGPYADLLARKGLFAALAKRQTL